MAVAADAGLVRVVRTRRAGARTPGATGASAMPIYEFVCKPCGNKFELLVPASKLDQVDCPSCKSGKVKRLMSTFAARSSGSDGSHSHGDGGCASCAAGHCSTCTNH